MSVTIGEPTRAAALRRLHGFAANAGTRYTKSRNFDFGPERRNNVSALSPYVRHRLVLEQQQGIPHAASFSGFEKLSHQVVDRLVGASTQPVAVESSGGSHRILFRHFLAVSAQLVAEVVDAGGELPCQIGVELASATAFDFANRDLVR